MDLFSSKLMKPISLSLLLPCLQEKKVTFSILNLQQYALAFIDQYTQTIHSSKKKVEILVE